MSLALRPVDWILLALLVAAWGSSFAMSKHALIAFDASWVMALRLSIAAAVLVPYAHATGQTLAAAPRVWLKFIWLGFIGNAFPFLVITWAMHHVSSGVAGLLMGAIPLFVVILAHFFLDDERLTPPKALGFILGFAGIVVLIGPAAIFSLSVTGGELLGELAVLLGCLCYAVHAVSAKRLGVEHPVQQAAAVCLSGAMMGLIAALAADPRGLSGIAIADYWSVIGLGLVPTALATLLVYRLMARTGPSFVSLSNYLVPVFAVLLGAAVLGEPLGWNILVASLLILGGIAVSRVPAGRWRTAA
jgi:drug/metabolite transporter (DMT)-like permease